MNEISQRAVLQQFFTGNSYDTPEDKPRLLLDRLFLNSRWYFIGGYIAEIFRTRPIAMAGLYDRNVWVDSSHRIFRLTENIGGRFHLRGLDHLRTCQPPLIIISNHMSTLETFILPCIIAPYMEVTFVVKDSLVRHPLFGPIMRSRDPIVVKRENPRADFQAVMTRGKELLAGGTSVIIFPQSTRSAVFIPEEFNSMGIKLAKAAGVQAMPVAVKTDFWENGKYLKDLGAVKRNRPIHIVFGRPFSIQGTGKEEHQKVVDFIVSHLREWGAVVRP
jgi:1-acyl-sn-glycerol-3-phosphate acyltransferase